MVSEIKEVTCSVSIRYRKGGGGGELRWWDTKRPGSSPTSPDRDSEILWRRFWYVPVVLVLTKIPDLYKPTILRRKR
jgi:hypothetical protein